MKRYVPSPSETVVIDGTCKAGLVMVTVTPGNAPPVESAILPLIPLVAWAAKLAANMRQPSPRHTICQPSRRKSRAFIPTLLQRIREKVVVGARPNLRRCQLRFAKRE